MIKPKTTANIDLSENYDQEEDVYYVTFKTNEPSYVMEVDDVLLWEMGIFSNMPTGFRILNFSKNPKIKIHIAREVKKAFSSAERQFTSVSRLREVQIEEVMEKVLA